MAKGGFPAGIFHRDAERLAIVWVFSGQWSVVSGQWSVVSGQFFVDLPHLFGIWFMIPPH
jgi:hypothetical protein